MLLVESSQKLALEWHSKSEILHIHLEKLSSIFCES